MRDAQPELSWNLQQSFGGLASGNGLATRALSSRPLVGCARGLLHGVWEAHGLLVQALQLWRQGAFQQAIDHLLRIPLKVLQACHQEAGTILRQNIPNLGDQRRNLRLICMCNPSQLREACQMQTSGAGCAVLDWD